MSAIALPSRRLVYPRGFSENALRRALEQFPAHKELREIARMFGGAFQRPFQAAVAAGDAVAAPFAPTDVAGLALWLKADAGLFQERTGAGATTPAAADGDQVGTWASQVGSIYLTAASDAKRATLKVNVQNSRNGVLFDGSEDALRNASAPTRTQPFTIYVVTKLGATGAARYFVANGATGNEWTIYQTNTPTANVYAGSAVTGGALSATTAYILRGVFNGASSSIRINNGTATTGNAGASADAGFTVGSNYNGAGSFFNGHVLEVLEYSGTVSAPNDALIMPYLNGRWATY